MDIPSVAKVIGDINDGAMIETRYSINRYRYFFFYIYFHFYY